MSNTPADARAARYLPDATQREAIRALWGHRYADAWVPRAAAALIEAADRWNLELGAPLSDGLGSIVAEVTLSDGTPAILKTAHCPTVAALEATALQAWDGQPTPQLLEHDSILGANLCSRLVPNNGTYTPADVVELSGRLKDTPLTYRYLPEATSAYDRILGWARQHRAGTPHHAQQLADAAVAERIFQTISVLEPHVMCHGDFSHKNLMPTDTGLHTYDPLPVLAPAYLDLAKWIAWGGADADTSLFELAQAVIDADRRVNEDRFWPWVWAAAVCDNGESRRASAHRTHFISDLRGCARQFAEGPK
jgi:hypothetical protein